MTPQTTKPFRFLDLPPEIRLMVYDRIDSTTHLHVYDGHQVFGHHFNVGPNDITVTIVSMYSTLSTSVLRISRCIHGEACPIFTKKLQALANEPLRFVTGVAGAYVLHNGMLQATLNRATLEMNGRAVFPSQRDGSYRVLLQAFDKRDHDLFRIQREQADALALFICRTGRYFSEARHPHALSSMKRRIAIETIVYPHLGPHDKVTVSGTQNSVTVYRLQRFCSNNRLTLHVRVKGQDREQKWPDNWDHANWPYVHNVHVSREPVDRQWDWIWQLDKGEEAWTRLLQGRYESTHLASASSNAV